MTSKIIAENILDADMFSSASDQDGEHIGQPEPNTNNTGKFRLLTGGAIQDFSYSGTATGDGAGGNTTTIDSNLAVYGDDYFIGATIEITSGGSDGESQTITDFARATGTLTHAAFSNQITTGTTFTLTLAFSGRSFDVELISSGDVGAATFKWSHDGGTTYFGRNDPYQATWLAQASVVTSVWDNDLNKPVGVQAANGNIVMGYSDDDGGNPGVYVKISSDKGITWGSAVTVLSTAYNANFKDLISLKNGRLLCLLTDNSNGFFALYMSDDYGETWSKLSTIFEANTEGGSLVGLHNGAIIVAYDNVGNEINCRISYDGGLNFGSEIEIAADANDQERPSISQGENGNVVCIYHSDEDAGASAFEIKGAYSDDYGTTWTSGVAVISTATRVYPYIIKDIDGTLYAVGTDQANDLVKMAQSTDNGVTWTHNAAITLITDTTNDPRNASLCLLSDGDMICFYHGDTSNDIHQVRRGMWELYTGDDSPPTANECPCAIERFKQHLCCDVHLLWIGNAGIAEDSWTFEPEYYYGMANIIDDSPSKPWRSETDNAECSIVIDTGANGRVLIDGIGFFGCNIRTLSFQMNDTDAWGAPSISESVSFDLVTGAVDAVAGRNIQDTSLLASYKDHALKGYYFRATGGTDDGVTWKILDNVGTWIVLDTASSHNMAAGSPADTFVIFQSWIVYTFTNTTPYRFIRLAIDAQHTADDYYQIGMAVMGKAISLTRPWYINYQRSNIYDIKMLRTLNVGLKSVKIAERKRKFALNWNGSEDTYNEIIATIDYLDGKNLCLIPDSSTLTDCYLVKSTSDIIAEHVQNNKFNFSLDLEEIL